MRTNLAGRVGRWSAAHWKRAAFGWLALAMIAALFSGAIPVKELKDSDVANGEAARAQQILEQGGFNVPATESVLVQSKTATIDEPAFNGAVANVVQALSLQPNVTNVVSPIENPGAGLVSRDRHSALVEFDIKDKADSADDRVAPILAAIDGVQAGNPSTLIQEFGQASANHELSQRFSRDMTRAEYTSLPATLAILVVAFGALAAAGLPVLLALSAILAATGLNAAVAHFVPTDEQTVSAVIVMMGMAVGIDYSLFYLRREREERLRGAEPHEALLRTARTSGQAVLVSGATVLIAMAGMLIAGNAIFTTISVGTMLVVFCAMVGSLTVLPAVLHRLGDKVDKGRVRVFRGLPRDDGAWSRLIGWILARPVRSVVLATGALLVCTLPVFSIHTKLPTYVDLPHDMKIIRTYERIQQAFPGSQTPAILVVRAPNVMTPQMQRAYALFRTRALATGELRRPFHVTVNHDRTVARIDFAIAGNGDNAASVSALRTLREDVIPPIAQSLPDVETAVTGITAGTYDFNEHMKGRMPFVFLFVLGLAFALLLMTFRSLVIAVTAVVLNLLSVAAAYGIIVAVFQFGWLHSVFGFQTNGAIITWIPLFLFVVLFGLSMDYHVFILSRVKELHDAGATTEDAVRLAITRTAGTVTSAAVIMVAVFGIFSSLALIQMQQMGFGLAVAVLIDATVVRAILVPATMKLLGEWNWYLPDWLGWLPSLSPEGDQPPTRRGPTVPVAH
jgi:uncharacterized membrane protein YdfJ with MMPL/SSD domain